MTADQLRGKWWKLHGEITGLKIDSTVDRKIAMAQAEAMFELAAQVAEANVVLKKIDLINFEEVALRLDRMFAEWDAVLRKMS